MKSGQVWILPDRQVGGSNCRHSNSATASSVSVIGVYLLAAEDTQGAGFHPRSEPDVFHKHVAMQLSVQAIHHIRHLLMELAQMLTGSLMLPMINYCNAVLRGTPISTI